MNTTLLEIKHHCNRRLFKFDLFETDSDILMIDVWTKDFKITRASIDGLRALKHYARMHNKALHVVAKSNKVFGILYNDGFHQNLLMAGRGDVSSLIPKSSTLMYSWRP
jgi:hypothetical protein